MELFEQYKITLKVSFRYNQHDHIKHPEKYKLKRQMSETFFCANVRLIKF
jgi:hypothetical protein